MRARTRPCGFSLLETLIAILVLSFGLLGMVGLQAAALQANREARLQSVAYDLVQELAELMRGNKDVGLLATDNPYVGDFSGSPLVPANTAYCLNVAGNGCSGASLADRRTLAQAQMTEWLARVEAELPGARVRVCADAAPYSADGLPQWNCTSAAASDPLFVKIGWTRGSTNRAATGADALVRSDSAASRPGLVFPVIAGSST